MHNRNAGRPLALAERSLTVSNCSPDIQATIGTLAGKALFLSTSAIRRRGLTTELRRSTVDITQVVNELSRAENGVVMFSSSTGREVSVEDQRWQNGAFTEAVLEAFAGKGDLTGDDTLSIAEFDIYLSERVKELTNHQQHPVTVKPDTIPDFPIAGKGRPDIQQSALSIVFNGKFKATEQPIDTSTAAGKCFLDMLGVFAEFETNFRREHHMEGIAKAKAPGVYKGRKPSIDAGAIRQLREQG